MNEDAFKPDFNLNINERLERFKDELIFWADTKFKTYFEQRTDNIDNQRHSHKIWFYIEPGITQREGKPVGLFGIRKGTNLPIDIREFFFDIYFKHFPDGHQSSHVYADIP